MYRDDKYMTYLALIKEHLYLFYIDINTQALIPIKRIFAIRMRGVILDVEVWVRSECKNITACLLIELGRIFYTKLIIYIRSVAIYSSFADI